MQVRILLVCCSCGVCGGLQSCLTQEFGQTTGLEWLQRVADGVLHACAVEDRVNHKWLSCESSESSLVAARGSVGASCASRQSECEREAGW